MDLQASRGLRQAAEADRIAVADHAGADLKIEHLTRRLCDALETLAEILPAGVDQNQDLFIGDQFPERLQVQAVEWIDERAITLACDLDQADLGTKLVLADELRVECEPACLCQLPA